MKLSNFIAIPRITIMFKFKAVLHLYAILCLNNVISSLSPEFAMEVRDLLLEGRCLHVLNPSVTLSTPAPIVTLLDKPDSLTLSLNSLPTFSGSENVVADALSRIEMNALLSNQPPSWILQPWQKIGKGPRINLLPPLL